VCHDAFREYLSEKVVKRVEDIDNALKKYFKMVITRFSEENA
jgi:hypothetical protein